MSDARYRTARWRGMRLAQLEAEPLCRFCRAQGFVRAATIADHVTPHRGDDDAFWSSPLQSLCKTCHDGAKQELEKSGTLRGCDAAGIPLDPLHPWHASDIAARVLNPARGAYGHPVYARGVYRSGRGPAPCTGGGTSEG